MEAACLAYTVPDKYITSREAAVDSICCQSLVGEAECVIVCTKSSSAITSGAPMSKATLASLFSV